MCSPLHATFLSTGQHLPAEPVVTDREQTSGAETLAAAATANPPATGALAPQPSTEPDPAGLTARAAPAYRAV
jgi:hypothetical protein